MFNFKEGLKRKMLKAQYFKHPDIAGHLYDRHLTTYGILPWNDEVFLYFEKLFYVELFLGMKPNYNDLPSEFFGPRKGRLCDRRGARHDFELSHPEPPLFSRPLRVKNLRSEMDATFQITLQEKKTLVRVMPMTKL